jgi:DNA anti-recombination protein RmuC
MDDKFEQIAKIIEICDAKDLLLRSDFDSLNRRISDLQDEIKQMHEMRHLERQNFEEQINQLTHNNATLALSA